MNTKVVIVIVRKI